MALNVSGKTGTPFDIGVDFPDDAESLLRFIGECGDAVIPETAEPQRSLTTTAVGPARLASVALAMASPRRASATAERKRSARSFVRRAILRAGSRRECSCGMVVCFLSESLIDTACGADMHD